MDANLIVRNFNQKEVLEGLYKAHGGADAATLFDSSELRNLISWSGTVAASQRD